MLCTRPPQKCDGHRTVSSCRFNICSQRLLINFLFKEHARPQFSRVVSLEFRKLWGASKMTIDLDSWEIGYADGQCGRPLQCPTNLDCFSYSSGYCEGRAYLADTYANKPVYRSVRRPQPLG
jgi:hypothetical protein